MGKYLQGVEWSQSPNMANYVCDVILCLAFENTCSLDAGPLFGRSPAHLFISVFPLQTRQDENCLFLDHARVSHSNAKQQR